jgi:hydroxymethylbilane synthase
MEAGEVDALVLALCGLERLDLSGHATEILPREFMLPAVGQGALAVECRTADQMVHQLLEPLHDPISAACVAAERAMLAALDGSCRTPVGGLAEINGHCLTIEGLLLNEDGSKEIHGRFEGGIDDAAHLGTELGKDLKGRAGPDFGLG